MNAQLERVLQRVTRWRAVFAGWQLGTRSDHDAECRAVRDHREVTLLLRIEQNALLRLLLEKDVITSVEFDNAYLFEAVEYEKGLERRFPGIRADEQGIVLTAEAAKTMKDWPP
jgi:hypothetical protein